MRITRAVRVHLPSCLLLVTVFTGSSVGQRPQPSRQYVDLANHALASGPDPWGDEALAQPDGPTYEALRHRLHPLFHSRTEKSAFELGVKFKAVKIVDNRYRWGSCTPTNSVHFNWRLIKAPTFVIDYVIVHELAHLLESNHTDRFWNIGPRQ